MVLTHSLTHTHTNTLLPCTHSLFSVLMVCCYFIFVFFPKKRLHIYLWLSVTNLWLLEKKLCSICTMREELGVREEKGVNGSF